MSAEYLQLPRHQKLALFDTEYKNFRGVYQLQHLPPIDSQVELCFQQALALDNPDIEYKKNADSNKQIYQLYKKAADHHNNQALSAGAMQKTINGKDGSGEFPIQVLEFKQEHKQLYKELFELCGWTVEGDSEYAVMKYQHTEFTEGKKVTGSKFIEKFRKNCNATTFTKITIEKNATPLAVIIKAISTPEFQKKQIIDFVKRLHKYLDMKTKYGFRIGDYIKSNLGCATVLDHSVNTPGHVVHDFNVALHYFFHLKSNIDKSHNPAEWGDNYLKYEKEIIDYYGPHRRMSGDDTKHPDIHATAVERFNKLKIILKQGILKQ